MSEDTHYKAPSDELLRALLVDPSQGDARTINEEPEPPHHLMQVLMKPTSEGDALWKTFLVKDFLFVPCTVYRVLAKTLSHIKGHNSATEEVMGVMKNMLVKIIHGIPINIYDFFMRTLVTLAQYPFELKPYTPWIMRFIRSRYSINYRDDH